MILHELKIIGITLFITGFCQTAAAINQVEVLALFKNKAMLNIDGHKYTLAVGELTPEGAKLIASSSENATLEINGQRRTFRLGISSSIKTGFNPPSQYVLQIYPDNRGMYSVQGKINNHSVKFLVDTGATTIAMNASRARRLGIDFKLHGQPMMVSTASGVSKGFLVKLDTVKVGDISMHNVDAMVLDGTHPTEVLLGMSFLGQVNMQRDGQTMRLKRKW